MGNFYFPEVFYIFKTAVYPNVKEEPSIGIIEIELQFKENFELLLIASFSILRDKNAASDVVQDFFEYYLKKKDSIVIKTSFQSYAVRAVKNMSCTLLKKMDRERFMLQDFQIEVEVQSLPTADISIPDEYDVIELLDRLPYKRREIFKSSVLNGLSYAEIAQAKGISVNTVKTQIKRAYAFLRAAVSIL